MSKRKSRLAERRADGRPIISPHPLPGLVPLHLIDALRECAQAGCLPAERINSEEQLKSLLSELCGSPDVGLGYGISGKEIRELVSIWAVETRNGSFIPPESVLPREAAKLKPIPLPTQQELIIRNMRTKIKLDTRRARATEYKLHGLANSDALMLNQLRVKPWKAGIW